MLKAVCDSNGNPPTLPPRGTETNEPIDAKFGRGDYVGEGTHHAKYHGRRFSTGPAPPLITPLYNPMHIMLVKYSSGYVYEYLMSDTGVAVTRITTYKLLSSSNLYRITKVPQF